MGEKVWKGGVPRGREDARELPPRRRIVDVYKEKGEKGLPLNH